MLGAIGHQFFNARDNLTQDNIVTQEGAKAFGMEKKKKKKISE